MALSLMDTMLPLVSSMSTCREAMAWLTAQLNVFLQEVTAWLTE